jgi:phospholipid N-methyltransferase
MAAEDGPVIELGPGTGVFTSALLDRGVPLRRIAVVEAGRIFADALSAEFPGLCVVHGCASRVRRSIPPALHGAATVICGLPLISMPRSRVHRILSGSFAYHRPEGTFRLFTYGPRCPVSRAVLLRLGLVARRARFVACNVPPASVYHLGRVGGRDVGTG